MVKNRNATLPVLFVQTSMPVGGAETLLVNLVQRMDRRRFSPEVACLKEPGPLGERLAEEGVAVHANLLSGKYDLRVLPRLMHLMRRRQIGAVITVGAGDKMFWGRLAAQLAGVPVVASALHSTGWPDGVGRLNRALTPITDAFIAVAEPHGEFLVQHERFPQERVHVIPNGVDTDRFQPASQSDAVREELGLKPTTPLVGILAALRPEKNHSRFLDAAQRIRAAAPESRFLIIGDGPERAAIESRARRLGLVSSDPTRSAVRLLGSRDDVPTLLAALNVLMLTSDNEANPVSILEAMSCGVPVVATDVGSVSESVVNGQTGFLVPLDEQALLAERTISLLDEPLHAAAIGAAGRARVLERSSLSMMVEGYENLLAQLYHRNTGVELPTRSGELQSTAARPESVGAVTVAS